jgi:hypothetical protein
MVGALSLLHNPYHSLVDRDRVSSGLSEHPLTSPDREQTFNGGGIKRTRDDDSDWDILVFANLEVLTKLREQPMLKRKQFDLFILYKDQDFEEAWPSGECKGGNLKEWEWKEISSKDAVYRSRKSKGKD